MERPYIICHMATSLDGKIVGSFLKVQRAADLPVQVFSLIMQRRSFAGSMIGGIRETQEMLDFCAEHHITAEIEVISANRIDEAWERVLASDVRYRFVIDISTMGNEYQVGYEIDYDR